MSQERDLNQELLSELQNKQPKVEGFVYLSEDPLGNLIYINDGSDGRPASCEYKLLLGGDPEKVSTLLFHSGNPEKGINGFTLEALIDICISRIVNLNDAVPDWRNNFAVDGLVVAANALNKRTSDRNASKVTLSSEPTPSAGDGDMHPIVRGILDNMDITTFTGKILLGISESFNQAYRQDIEDQFMDLQEVKPDSDETPKAKIKLTAKEDEAITVAVHNASKVINVLKDERILKILLGTIVHSKKLQASKDTSGTSESNETQETTTQQ